jgi:hypothetical protein
MIRRDLSERRLVLALLALALGGFTIGTGEFVAMGLLPQIAGGVGVSVPDAGHASSAYAAGVVVGAPLLAGLGARLPRRRLLVALAAAFAVGNLLSALAPSYGTLIAARFVCGLPHGTFFGVACLVAAELAPPERRARAVAGVLAGLSVANVVGVPAATWLGQGLGWRAAFAAAATLSVLTALGILRQIPGRPADPAATLRRELGALRRGQVWLALAVGAIGGGGFFAVYTYITPRPHRPHGAAARRRPRRARHPRPRDGGRQRGGGPAHGLATARVPVRGVRGDGLLLRALRRDVRPPVLAVVTCPCSAWASPCPRACRCGSWTSRRTPRRSPPPSTMRRSTSRTPWEQRSAERSSRPGLGLTARCGWPSP